MRQPYQPKPATAAWIQRERRRAGLSVAELRERLALIGVTVTEQTIRVWEGNSPRPPGPERLDALERIFGSQAPDRLEATETPADLIAALMAQTAAQSALTAVMGELVSELRAARELAPEVRDRVAALEGYAAEHERRLQADRERMGLAQPGDPQSQSELPAGARS